MPAAQFKANFESVSRDYRQSPQPKESTKLILNVYQNMNKFHTK